MSDHDENQLFHSPPDNWSALKPRARQMRHEPTPAEQRLWERIRNRQIGGAKFRRQYAVGRYIVDFVCLEQRLIIEVDGGIHDRQQDYDEARQSRLESTGFRVIRFSNGEIMDALEGGAAAIARA